MSRHKTGNVISYHGILCHDMSYVTTIAASLLYSSNTSLVSARTVATGKDSDSDSYVPSSQLDNESCVPNEGSSG